MFVAPRLVGSLGRSNWKTLQDSPYFWLQQRGQNQAEGNGKRRHVPEYRIVTRRFPHYRVAHSDDYSQAQESFAILHDEVVSEIEGKKTSKKILKQVRAWIEKNNLDNLVFDEDGYASDSSGSNEDVASSVEAFDITEATKDGIASSSSDMSPQKRSSAPVENGLRHGGAEDIARNSDVSEYDEDNSSSGEGRDNHVHSIVDKSLAKSRRDKRKSSSTLSPTDSAANTAITSSIEDYWPFLTSLVDSLMQWVEGPAVEKLARRNNVGHQGNKDPGLLNIPLHFIALLTYPEIEPNTKVSLTGFFRPTTSSRAIYFIDLPSPNSHMLLGLVFCVAVFEQLRDAFPHEEFGAVRQRIGWAKQWAGALFRNRTPSSSVTAANQSPNQLANPSASQASPPYTVLQNNSIITALPSTPTNSTTSTKLAAVHMTKTTSHDANFQSGSLSDTTHGGSVAKLSSRKGFFKSKSASNNVHNNNNPGSSGSVSGYGNISSNHSAYSVHTTNSTTTGNNSAITNLTSVNQDPIAHSQSATTIASLAHASIPASLSLPLSSVHVGSSADVQSDTLVTPSGMTNSATNSVASLSSFPGFPSSHNSNSSGASTPGASDNHSTHSTISTTNTKRRFFKGRNSNGGSAASLGSKGKGEWANSANNVLNFTPTLSASTRYSNPSFSNTKITPTSISQSPASSPLEFSSQHSIPLSNSSASPLLSSNTNTSASSRSVPTPSSSTQPNSTTSSGAQPILKVDIVSGDGGGFEDLLGTYGQHE
ncbi:547_t:CDS:2 [Paraglomus brasilianum]|uniref:547_t:CDS:1 n=1 Tax=Paraglomus brasilianum TaxID=144538 RepID=A0A9N9A9K3_9GLOM|nr:547_t:CDS:2 [Paraglomus brasilianum]